MDGGAVQLAYSAGARSAADSALGHAVRGRPVDGTGEPRLGSKDLEGLKLGVGGGGKRSLRRVYPGSPRAIRWIFFSLKWSGPRPGGRRVDAASKGQLGD
jgi:hypothetical protein